MGHHKQLPELHRRLDKAKRSRSPERRELYEHVEEAHLQTGLDELRGRRRSESFLDSVLNIWEQ